MYLNIALKPPQAMEPIHTVGNRMQAFLKVHNLKCFTCVKCGCEKKSGLGFISHIEVSIEIESQISHTYLTHGFRLGLRSH